MFFPFQEGSLADQAMSIPGAVMSTIKVNKVSFPIPGTSVVVSGKTCPSAKEAAEDALKIWEVYQDFQKKA